jgi:zinc transport system permease protein
MSQLALLALPFMQKAIVSLVLASVTLSLLGVAVIVLNLASVRFALMHLGLLGATLGLVAGLDPTITGLVAITAGAFLFGPVSDWVQLDTSAISAFFMTGSLAAAFILLHKAGIPAMDAFTIFTGSILMLTEFDLWVLLLLGVGIVAMVCGWYWEINLVLYNRELATALGVRTRAVYYTLLLVLGCAIGVAIKLVGALMVDAIILLPAMTALPLARSLRQAFLLTALVGAANSLIGASAALIWDLPISAAVTLTGVLCLVLIQAWREWRGKKARRSRSVADLAVIQGKEQ